MSGGVIQGTFLGGRPKLAMPVPAPVAQPRMAQAPGALMPAPQPPAMPRPPGPPMPAHVAQARMPAAPPPAMPRPPGPPAPAHVVQPRMAQAQPRPAQPHAASGAIAVDPALLRAAARPGQPLPDAVQRKMEQAFGADFSSVRVHEGPQAESIGAIAFTVGTDIYFAPGRFQPHTAAGQQLLGHELTHVLQQRAGRVRNPLGSGLAVVQDHALEAEADRMGHRAAAQMMPAAAAQPKRRPGTTPAVQANMAQGSTPRSAPGSPCSRSAAAVPALQTRPALTVAQARRLLANWQTWSRGGHSSSTAAESAATWTQTARSSHSQPSNRATRRLSATVQRSVAAGGAPPVHWSHPLSARPAIQAKIDLSMTAHGLQVGRGSDLKRFVSEFDFGNTYRHMSPKSLRLDAAANVLIEFIKGSPPTQDILEKAARELQALEARAESWERYTEDRKDQFYGDAARNAKLNNAGNLYDSIVFEVMAQTNKDAEFGHYQQELGALARQYTYKRIADGQRAALLAEIQNNKASVIANFMAYMKEHIKATGTILKFSDATINTVQSNLAKELQTFQEPVIGVMLTVLTAAQQLLVEGKWYGDSNLDGTDFKQHQPKQDQFAGFK